MVTSTAVVFLVLSFSNFAASVLSRVAEEESIQVKKVLNHLSDAKCDKIMVASTYFHGKVYWNGKGTFTNAFKIVFPCS